MKFVKPTELDLLFSLISKKKKMGKREKKTLSAALINRGDAVFMPRME